MTITKTLMSLTLASALAVLSAPAIAQTTMPAQPETPRSATGGEQSPDAMREVMREMMQEMRQEMQQGMMGRDAPRGRWEGRSRMRDRDAMGHGGMMRDRAGQRGMMHGAGMRLMFAIMDADGDGVLTLEEVQDFHERIFNTIDQDGSGDVTLDEIRQFFTGTVQ